MLLLFRLLFHGKLFLQAFMLKPTYWSLPVLGVFERQADSLVTFFTCFWRFWSPIRLIGVLSFRFLDFSVTNTAHW